MSETIRHHKADEIEAIKEKIQSSKAIILVDYKGLTVAKDTKLRVAIRKAGIEYKVLKNTYVRRAFNELGINSFDEALNGPTAVAFSSDDEAACCKTIFEQTKANDGKFVIKCGSIAGEFTSAEDIAVLAKLPSKNELIAKLMATINAPVQYVVYALNAIKEKEENPGEETANA